MAEKFAVAPGLSNYKIGSEGTIIRTATNQTLKPYKSGNYLSIKLTDDKGKRRNYLLHRLVASVFVKNPNNLPEVNHLDRNPLNCKSDNLEWCTRLENLNYSNILDNPVKNKIMCKVYDGEVFIKEFATIKQACQYAADTYNLSFLSLYKYHSVKGSSIRIVPEDSQSDKCVGRKRTGATRRIETEVFVDGKLHAIFPSIIEAKEYVENTFGYSKGNFWKSNSYKNVELRPRTHTKKKRYSNFGAIQSEV